MNIYQLLAIIFIGSIFGVLIYLISKMFSSQCPSGYNFNSKQNKCIINCTDKEIYDDTSQSCKINCNGHPITDSEEILTNGTCTKKCSVGEIRDPKCGCYNSEQLHCDNYGNLCDDTKYCNVLSGTGPHQYKCCPSDQICDKTDINNQICKTCPNEVCNGVCCPCKMESGCINNNCCCPPSKSSVNSKGESTCCLPEDLCGGICCDRGGGESCNPATNKCEIGCPDTRDMDKDLYKCNDKIPPPFTGTKKFCGDGEFCFHDCNTNEYNCYENKNCWDKTLYTPGLLADKNADPYILSIPDIPQGAVNVCSDQYNNRWIYNGYTPIDSKDPGLRATVSTRSNLPDKTKTCDKDSCINRIIQDSTTIVNFQKPTDTGTVINNNGICSTDISCDKALLTRDNMIYVCRDLDSDPETSGRCCKTSDGNDYTGQVCGQGSSCIRNSDGTYKCQQTSTYCGEYGNWSNTLNRCICISDDYAGNRCQFSRKDTCYGKGTPTGDGNSCPQDCNMDPEHIPTMDSKCQNDSDIFNADKYTCPTPDISDRNQTPYKPIYGGNIPTGESCGIYSKFKGTCGRYKICN
jgi:hypothetical protein